MRKENQYLLYILEKLQPHGPIRERAMFGGYGIYYNDVIFAVIVDDELYFRMDETTKAEYEALDSKPFVYEGMKKPVRMPYYTLPEEILENAEVLPAWIEKAYQVSLKNKKPKKTKK